MKATKILTVLMILCFVAPTQAQFLKKLKKRAEKAVEQTVLNRTDKEVSEATDKAIDGVMESENQSQQNSKADQMQENIQSLFGAGNLEKIPDQYVFSYKARMEITSNNDKTEIEYWLEPDVRYFGTKIAQEDGQNLTVLDLENKSMTMFMQQDDKKLIMPMRTDAKVFKKIIESADEQTKTQNMEYVEIESKTILGYHCKGYKYTTEEGVSKIWITNQTPVGIYSGLFNKDYDFPTTNIPMDGESMIMEMQFVPAKNNKDKYTMKCIEFTKEEMSVKKDDYTSMLQY